MKNLKRRSEFFEKGKKKKHRPNGGAVVLNDDHRDRDSL